jgi:FdhD protein
MTHPSTPVRVTAVRVEHSVEKPDYVVTEEPMEIRVSTRGSAPEPVAVTMRTPGHDFELAAGFMLTEGLAAPADITSVRYCDLPDGQPQEYNVVTVTIRRPFDIERRRRFTTASSCGTCGKASIDQVEVMCAPVQAPAGMVTSALIHALPDKLRAAQRVFGQTGGLHAAGLFTCAGDLRVLREDVGRHNAVDKVIGHAALTGELPLRDGVLMVSGRVSFEIVQKAAVAGIPVLCAVSAPSSLAVDGAERLGVTVVGFVRNRSFNVYTRADRVAVEL